jgi:predicted acetyltransferase
MEGMRFLAHDTIRGLTSPSLSSQLVLSKIGPHSEPLLRNLFEFYLHDMSEWLHFDTGADGSYSYDTSALWAKGHDIYLAKVGDSIAGFALVGSAARWLGNIGAHEIVEFFVLRRFRRSGIGQQMAERLWSAYPGEWLVRVLESNVPAIPFWRSAIASYSQGKYAEQPRTVNDRPWRFFRFKSTDREGSVANVSMIQ